MPDTPDPAAPPEPPALPAAPAVEPLVDTTPATPERTGVTYGILFVVLAALTAFFVVRALHR